ncbi:MAG TPA: hypothetical protein P5233_20525 [Candidatus Paceibacterota bacterium]|nr:hypothetical protein [Candidatus Paceibacterota bacterium]
MKALTRKVPFRVLAGLLAVSLAVFLGGCSSPEKGSSNGFASVTIRGNTPGQISEAAIAVFTEAGYTVVVPGRTRLVFEKQGSSMNNLAYGSWLGDTPVWIRVRASVVPAGEATYRLECRAWMVRDHGANLEEEVKVSSLARGTYQKLLDEVARRLGSR